MVVGLLNKNAIPASEQVNGKPMNVVSLSGLDTIKKKAIEPVLEPVKDSIFPDIMGTPKAPDPKNIVNKVGSSPLLRKFICQVIQVPHMEDLFQTVIDSVKKEKYTRKKEENLRSLTQDETPEFDTVKKNIFTSFSK